jgi:hypothetical protein
MRRVISRIAVGCLQLLGRAAVRRGLSRGAKNHFLRVIRSFQREKCVIHISPLRHHGCRWP